MSHSKSPNRTSSGSPSVSSYHSSASDNHKNRLPSPLLSEYEYVGRSIARERPIIRKPNVLHESHIFLSNTNRYFHSTRTHRQEINEEDVTSSDDDVDDLSKPFAVIRINDRHFREIYRLPTPPSEIKRVFHRLRSPEPKIIERVFVHRLPLEVIENIIEVPPEQVRIINRERYLRKSKPIIRTNVVYLKPHHHPRSENQQSRTLAYSAPISDTQPTIPSHMMLNSKQFSNPQITQPSTIPLNYAHKYFQY